MWKKLVCLLSVVAILFGAMGLAGCVNEEKRARKYIRNTSGIEVPEDVEMVFHHRQECFQERDALYSSFRFTDSPIDWLTENEFSDEKNSDFEKDFRSSLRAWRADEKIPGAYIPDFDESYFWLVLQDSDRARYKEYFICFSDKYYHSYYILVIYISII